MKNNNDFAEKIAIIRLQNAVLHKWLEQYEEDKETLRNKIQELENTLKEKENKCKDNTKSYAQEISDLKNKLDDYFNDNDSKSSDLDMNEIVEALES